LSNFVNSLLNADGRLAMFEFMYHFNQGRSQTFSFGGATGGPSFAARGAVNGLCRTFRKRPTPVA